MKNKVVVLYLSAALAFGNNSMIASQGSINDGNESSINNTKLHGDNKFSERNTGDQHTKNLNDKKEENDESQKKLAGQISQQKYSFNLNIKKVNSSFKKKLDAEGISGDVFSIKGNFIVSFLKDITYKRAYTVTFGDDLKFCGDDKTITLSGSEKWKNAGWAVLSWFLDAERELSIYGYKITQNISPLSVKSNAGYRVNLFSVKNVFNVLNRFSYTNLNPGCMDFLNVSLMRNDAYIKTKEDFLEKKHKLLGLCIDIFSVNKKFSNLLEIGFLLGTHCSSEEKCIEQFLKNAALQFSLNCTCKYIFLNLKLIGYYNSNNMMCKLSSSNMKAHNVYLDYTSIEPKEDVYVVPVKIKLGSSILKGKKMTAWGRNSLIFKDICLEIKTHMFFNKSLFGLFSYDLSLNFSLEKYIDIAVGICSHDKGLKMCGEVKNLAKVDNNSDTYGEINSYWIYFPIPYLKIQINWLELRK